MLTGATLIKIRKRFAAVADTLVANLLDRGRFDAQIDLANAFPLIVVPTMLGLAPEDRDVMIAYSDLNFNSMGPDNSLRRASVARTAGIPARVEALCRRDSLAGDGLGARIFDECDKAGLSEEDAAILVRTFFSASMDTTANGIGMTIHALARDPN
ncbi:MAG: cytochrome [Sphingomonas bacterium]|nr:cytochrome [Sphingomonas bacterium]